MSFYDMGKVSATKPFEKAAANDNQKPDKPKKKGVPAPFSLRLTQEERTYLESKAGKRPLGSYIRDQLLGNRQLKRRKQRRPSVDDERYAVLLDMLRRTNYASNLNQLAKAANIGTLEVSNDTEQQINQACSAVIEMRDVLVNRK